MKKGFEPPQWVDSLIDNLAPHHFAEEIRGDLHELFVRDMAHLGLKAAQRRYVRNGLGFLARSFFWKRQDTNQPTSIMLRTYFKMATRSLSAYKGTAFINTLGLVTAIASALVILAVIRFELSFDKFHSNAERIYRMVRISGADMSEFRTGISYPVPDAMEEAITSLERIVSIEYMGGVNVDVVEQSGESTRMFREEAGLALVDDDFFEMFDFRETDFRWLAGNRESALKEAFSVVLTETMAKKYFGGDDPLGRILRFQKKYDCKVTGVTTDFPANTDFPFTMMVSYETLRELSKGDESPNWFSVNDSHHTYISLPPEVSKTDMEAQIAKVHASHTPKELHESRHYLLQQLEDVHHDARFGNFGGRTISKQTILGLALVGLFLLLTGCFNYINLSTAQASMRAKEIGLRKVMGSNRKNLVFQVLAETFLVVLAAGIVGLALSEIILLNLQSLLNMRLDNYNFMEPWTLASWAAIIVAVTLFSGSYPSLVISRFNPITAIQNKFATESFAGIRVRKVLVVAQFTITQMLVVGTFIVVGQMRFFQNQDMGFTREAILTTRISDVDPVKRRTIENQLRAQPYIQDVSFSYTTPSGVRRNRSFMDIGLPSANSMSEYVVFEFAPIDTSYLRLYNIPLLAGRNLVMNDTIGNILVNEALMKNLGIETPDAAVGKELKMGSDKVTVVGVVGNYFSNSLKESVDNVVMLIREENYSTLNIKLNITDRTGSIGEAIKGIETVWARTYPEFIFTYQFLDDNIQAFYAQEEKYAKLFQIFSAIFLVIGCLGLYGLITFVVNRKGKEVAVRKVLGATVANILLLFSSEYIRLIALSFLLAVPVTYYIVNDWLNNFESHIALSWWIFVVPGLLVLVIALSVILIKSLSSAKANPVDRLKYE